MDSFEYVSANEGGCWFCSTGECDNFTFEWDSYVHEACVRKEAENGDLEAYIIYEEWKASAPELVENWNVPPLPEEPDDDWNPCNYDVRI